jgi:hypothetical protein
MAVQFALYKNRMLTAGIAEATINRRLAAVKSLLKMAHRIGYSQNWFRQFHGRRRLFSSFCSPFRVGEAERTRLTNAP